MICPLLLYCAVVGCDSIDDVTSCTIVVILCCSWQRRQCMTQLMICHHVVVILCCGW